MFIQYILFGCLHVIILELLLANYWKIIKKKNQERTGKGVHPVLKI